MWELGETSFSLPQAYQENPLDIGFVTFPLFVFDAKHPRTT